MIETKTTTETATLKAVDLGLPSGTLWADRNLGADAPENTGDFFRFGETEPFTEKCLPYEYKKLGDGFEVAGTENDAASAILGQRWQTPTEDQVTELHDYCTGEWQRINGIKGLKVTGPNGNSIFLPLAGNLNQTGELSDQGKIGCIWTSSCMGGEKGLLFFWMSGYWYVDTCDRAYGFTVRPVTNY